MRIVYIYIIIYNYIYIYMYATAVGDTTKAYFPLTHSLDRLMKSWENTKPCFGKFRRRRSSARIFTDIAGAVSSTLRGRWLEAKKIFQVLLVQTSSFCVHGTHVFCFLFSFIQRTSGGNFGASGGASAIHPESQRSAFARTFEDVPTNLQSCM